MSTLVLPLPSAGTPAARLSTRLAFFIAGFGMAAWAPLVPFAKARAGLDDGTLGLLLLCLGAGSIIAMPVSGMLAARHGCRLVILWAALGVCVALPALAWVSAPALLVLALFVFGASVGTVDCVINIQAVIVERQSGMPLMSGFHGLFSVGGIAGAAGVSALLGLGASPLAASVVVVALILAALAVATPRLLPYGGEGEGMAFAMPRGIVAVISALCFVVFLTEGSVLDWSAVFLTTLRGLDPARAGLGYACFAALMTLGRLTGDRIVGALGGARVLTIGGVLAAAGLAVAMLVPAWQAGLIGYALVGAGCSNIVPVLYSAVGRQTVMPEHAAVPVISTIGYGGILAGPALIGLMAGATSLPAAFLVVAVALLGVAACGRLFRA